MSELIPVDFKGRRRLDTPEKFEFTDIEIRIPESSREEIKEMAIDVARTLVFPVMYGEGNKSRSFLLLLNILHKCGVDLQSEGQKYVDEQSQTQGNNNGLIKNQTDKGLDVGGSTGEEEGDKWDSPA